MKSLMTICFIATLSISCQKDQSLEMNDQIIQPTKNAALSAPLESEIEKAELTLNANGIIFTSSMKADKPSACSIDSDYYYKHSNAPNFNNNELIDNLNIYIDVASTHLEKSKTLSIAEDGTISKPNGQAMELLERKINCAKFILGQRSSSQK